MFRPKKKNIHTAQHMERIETKCGQKTSLPVLTAAIYGDSVDAG